jgi:hypothetical protein
MYSREVKTGIYFKTEPKSYVKVSDVSANLIVDLGLMLMKSTFHAVRTVG